MQRDMAYDLDGAFSTRNQGQLIATKRVQTQALRTPGLQRVRDTEEGGMGRRLTNKRLVPMTLGNVELPVIGQVHMPSLLLGGVAIGLAFWAAKTR